MLLTRAEVAAKLRVHEATVDRYIKAGLIKAIKGRHSVRISEEALRDYLDQNVISPDADDADAEPGRETEESAAMDVPGMRVAERVVAHDLPELRGLGKERNAS